MTRIQTPAPSDSKPDGLSGLNKLLLSFSNTDTVHSVEAVSITTLHGMLSQVLEQTTALWKAQASTNHILDELRQLIPAPQENTETHERLCRVESLLERLANSQRVGLHPLAQSSQGIGAGAFSPQSVPVSSFAPNLPPCQSRMMSTHETAPLSPIPHAGGEECSLPESLACSDDEDEVPGTCAVPPSAHGDPLTADAVISPKQIRLSIPRHHSAHTSTISLVPSMQSGNNSEAIMQRQDPLEASVQKPSSPQPFEDAGANSIQHVQSICADNKVLMEQHLMRMASWPMEDRAAVRKSEQSSRKIQEDKHRTEEAVQDKIHKHNTEHEDFFQTLSDTWRADIRRLKEEVIGTVRATACEQIPFNIQGYLDEFSRTLSTEVRMLLNDVGTLREERQRIQHELGYLMMTQSTFRSGEFGADRLPDYLSLAARPSLADIPLLENPVPRPAWRTLPTRGSRRYREAQVPPPPPVPVRQQHSRTTWQPNPALAPSPLSTESSLLVPDRGSPGLFGPRSPRDSLRELPQQAANPESQGSCDSGWDTWQHLAETPPLAPISLWSSPIILPVPEPTIPVVRCASPGLFGPRSPRNSLYEPPKQVASESQDARDAGWDAWDAWQPSPLIAPTPPYSTPTIPVLERGSPGLFGPRSPGEVLGALPSESEGPDSSKPSLISFRSGGENPSLFGPLYPTS
ncbi:hypothetical protein JVU11DRAFT_9508 [Chiua virens]|nr:hypothetical protein JVU11DRAFT_9508 [Chiua virens]